MFGSIASFADDFCHIGFVVRDMERAISDWKAQGASVVIEPTLDPVQNVICAYLTIQGMPPVELVAPTGHGKSPLESRLKKGGGLDHICCFVDDMDSAISDLNKKGGRLLVEPVFGCVWNRTIAFVYIPTGLVVELMTRRISDPSLRDPLAVLKR